MSELKNTCEHLSARALPGSLSEQPGAVGSDRFAGALALGVTLAGLAVAIVLCIASDGFYHDDDITHYAFAAQGWSNIGTLFNSWGRPGLTIPMAPVAHWFGLFGCRIFSSLMTAATAYLAYLIARRILASLPRGAYLAALAPALVWLQPLTMTLAATTLTETPAGLYLTLGVWLFMRGNKIAGPIVTSFAFISRFEILTLAPIMWAMAAYEALKQSNWKPSSLLKTWPCALGLLAAPIAYAAVAIILEHMKLLSLESSPLYMFFHAQRGADEYGTGGWSHFLIQWVMAAGPGILGLAAAGALCFARKAIVPTLLALQLVAAETVLYHYGLFASGGYARFLVPIGGLTAAIAAAGLAAVVLSHRKFGAGISLAVIGAVLLVATVTSGDASGKTLANLWLIWSRLGQAVTAIRGLSSPDPDLVSQTVAAMTVAWIVLGIIGLASVVARARPARIALATIAVLTTTAFVGAAAFEIRPLSIASSSMHVVVRDVVRQLEQTPYADNPCLTCHVLVGQLRTGQTIGGLNFHSACEAWEKSPPGTLFFWENKYCIRSARRGEDRPEHPQDELGIALARDGQMIASANNFEANGDDCAEVYVRDDPKATSQALGQPDKD